VKKSKRTTQSEYGQARSFQIDYSYDEIIEKFKGILGDLKLKNESVKNRCSGTYSRVIATIRSAKNGEKIKRRELVLELQGIINAILSFDTKDHGVRLNNLTDEQKESLAKKGSSYNSIHHKEIMELFKIHQESFPHLKCFQSPLIITELVPATDSW
jgi:hypothetical protein